MYLPVNWVKLYKWGIESRISTTLAHLRLSLLATCEKGFDLFWLIELVYFNKVLILLERNCFRILDFRRVLLDLEILFENHGSTVMLYVTKKLTRYFAFLFRILTLLPCIIRITVHFRIDSIDLLLWRADLHLLWCRDSIVLDCCQGYAPHWVQLFNGSRRILYI